MTNKRSPILGYNHNFVYRGLVFHVQTEDSGVNNPHVFTHLFHGGVILSSRRLDYDAEASEDVVKALMRAQHKAVLKDLKKGTFDVKIDDYLGDHPDLVAAAGTTEPQPPPVAPNPAWDPPVAAPVPREFVPEPGAPIPIVASVSERIPARHGIPAESAPRRARSATAGTGDPVVTFRQSGVAVEDAAGEDNQRSTRRRAHTTGGYSQVRGRQTSNVPLPIPEQPTQPTPRRGPGSRSSVVVSRPAVIISAPSQVIGGQQTSASRSRRASTNSDSNVFGQDLISEKSLDEVILAYLSDEGEDT